MNTWNVIIPFSSTSLGHHGHLRYTYKERNTRLKRTDWWLTVKEVFVKFGCHYEYSRYLLSRWLLKKPSIWKEWNHSRRESAGIPFRPINLQDDRIRLSKESANITIVASRLIEHLLLKHYIPPLLCIQVARRRKEERRYNFTEFRRVEATRLSLDSKVVGEVRIDSGRKNGEKELG